MQVAICQVVLRAVVTMTNLFNPTSFQTHCIINHSRILFRIHCKFNPSRIISLILYKVGEEAIFLMIVGTYPQSLAGKYSSLDLEV